MRSNFSRERFLGSLFKGEEGGGKESQAVLGNPTNPATAQSKKVLLF